MQHVDDQAVTPAEGKQSRDGMAKFNPRIFLEPSVSLGAPREENADQHHAEPRQQRHVIFAVGFVGHHADPLQRGLIEER